MSNCVCMCVCVCAIDHMQNIPYRKHSNEHVIFQQWIDCKCIHSMDAWDVINTSFIVVISIIKEIAMNEGLLAAQMLSYSLIEDTNL